RRSAATRAGSPSGQAELKDPSKVPSGSGATESTLRYQCFASKVRVPIHPPRAYSLSQMINRELGFLGVEVSAAGQEHPSALVLRIFHCAGRSSEKPISMAPQANPVRDN